MRLLLLNKNGTSHRTLLHVKLFNFGGSGNKSHKIKMFTQYWARSE